jgi:uncharacterized protein YndB with AHSA1/START domain
MKPGMDVKSRGRPAGAWAGAPDGREDLHRIGSAVPVHAERTGRSASNAEQYAVVRVTRRFRASPARIFDAWLDTTFAGRWLFATASSPMAQVEIDARVDGSFRFVDRRGGEITEYTGEYLEIDPHRHLAFTLSLGQHPNIVTRVTVEVSPQKKGCELTLTHENVPQDHADHIEGRWTGILYGLGVTLDSVPTAFHDD